MSSMRSQLFYRKFGVRLVQQVMSPVMYDIALLELPMKSIYHYVTYDGIELGPPPDDYLFRNIKKPIFVESISNTGDTLGNPRKITINEANLLREYRSFNRRIRPLRSLEAAAKDPLTLIVYNYCFIGKTYRYIRSFYTEYYKWHNTFAAICDNMAKAAEITDSQQFITCGVPRIIPSLGQLQIGSKGLTQQLLKVFKEPNAFILLELWKWLSDKREESLFNRIPKEKIHLINLVYQEAGKWSVLNLGYLNSFRKLIEEQPEEELGYVIKGTHELEPIQIQKRLLKFLMKVMEARTATSDIIEDPKLTEKPLVTEKVKTDYDELIDEEVNLPEFEEPEDESEHIGIAAPKASTTLSEAIHQTDLTEDTELLDETPEEALQRIQEEDDLLDHELSQLNEIADKHEQEHIDHVTDVSAIMEEKEAPLEDGIGKVCDRLAEDGLLTAGEYKRFNALALSYQQMKAPYDKNKTIAEHIQIKPEELLIDNKVQFTDSDLIIDKSMLKSTLQDFDSKYIKDILPRHTTAMVMNIQKAGIAVTGYEIEQEEDILGAYENHTIKLVPVEGQTSTIKFKIPKIDEDGTFKCNNVTYALRKQRGELPIRKVDYNRVALTSYYGKAFVNRGRKKQFDYGFWLQSKVMEKVLNDKDNDIQALVPADVFDQTLKTARSYTALSMTTKSLMSRGYTVYFDQNDVKKFIPDEIVSFYAQNDNLVIGTNNLNYLILDPLGSVYTTENNQLNLFGTLEHFLNINTDLAPVEFAELVVFGKEIPMGIVLAYHVGLNNLCKLLKVTPRRVEAGTRAVLGLNEYSLVFSDETLIFSKDDKLATMILAGFNDYHRTIRLFSVYSFDKRGVYLNLLDANKLGVRYLRELDLMYQMFIDPITKQLLEEMNEPQTFQGLLFRACEMLLDDTTPDELDPAFMRIKGYERISGAVYAEIIQALRVHNGLMGKSNKKIDINPYAVWKRITEDPAKMQVSEINPIQALKEQEAVTYAGQGGRNKRSMTKNTRAYHPNDMGTISEATVDSSDVAINVFTSANPKLKSVLGISERYDFKQDGATSLLSTSALLAPYSDNDDPKRVNFVNIQNGHCLATAGYHQPTVRTGYEEVVADRSSDLFAITAKKPGKVKSINKQGIIIEYEDGEVKGYELGRRYGNAAGLTIPHTIVSPLKEGDTLSLGDAIIYNSGFFEPDLFNPKRVVFKTYMTVKTVLWESNQTLEDASSISTRIAEQLKSKVTKVKNVILRFDQVVNRLVKPGDKVEADTILCIIQEAMTANSGMFTEETLDTLRIVGSQAPRAHVKGIVERVEVYYHGDKDDMSESIRALADTSDKQFKSKATSLGKKGFTGSVDTGFRIDNDPLALDTLAVRIYITTDALAGVGDQTYKLSLVRSISNNRNESSLIARKSLELNKLL